MRTNPSMVLFVASLVYLLNTFKPSHQIVLSPSQEHPASLVSQLGRPSKSIANALEDIEKIKAQPRQQTRTRLYRSNGEYHHVSRAISSSQSQALDNAALRGAHFPWSPSSLSHVRDNKLDGDQVQSGGSRGYGANIAIHEAGKENRQPRKTYRSSVCGTERGKHAQVHTRLARRLPRRADLFQDSRAPSCDSRPAIFGIRCDEGGEISDGILVIKANQPTEIILIGQNLNTNMSIALTSEEQGTQADCTHADRVKSLQFKNFSSNIAQVVIDAPATVEKRPYYLCLRDDSMERWYHQGSDPWLKLYVKEDFLPLYMKIIVIACLLMLSGLFSGLNLGLMALDKNELQVIISCGSDTEKRYARAIEPVRRRGNYLLCSILFSNVLVNSTIAVLLEELTSGIVAVMTSTIFIVMFGEILPQAFCSRHGLAVGAKTVSLTYFCMIVTFPLSYPVSSCLDWVLGEEIGHAYDRERLMEFIRVTRDYNNLETDEVNIISGALKLKRIPLSEVMTRIDDVYMLDVNSCLDFDTIQSIVERGYSRVPIHEAGNKKNIVALLFTKDLALLDPDDRTPVQTLISFYDHPIMYLFEDTTLDLALNEFKTGKSHMAFVRRVIDDGDRDPVYEITGIVTLEDVIEEIMQMEINDETDTLSDNRRKRRRKEAQVRRDFSQFTNFGVGDASFNVVTPQLCLAAYQYLATTVEPFSAKYISDSILKRLLSQKIYHRVRVDDSHRERRLYTAGEQADYFIMILEGRVHVICGKENLVFEGGPFSFFGKAALSTSDKPDTLMIANAYRQRKGSNTKQPFLSATAIAPAQRDNSPGQRWPLNGQLSVSMRKLEQTVNETDMGIAGGPLGMNTTSTSRLKSSASIQSVDKMASFIIPDYTVEIVTNASYLKITRNEYLAALKATCVERGTSFGDDANLTELYNGPGTPQSVTSTNTSIANKANEISLRPREDGL